MRFFSVILALLAGAALSIQENRETYGKTEAQILSMGFDKWMEFTASKGATSTAGMTESAGTYGEIAKKRNDKLIAKLDAKKKGKILGLRKGLDKFDTASIDVAYVESGGGTMYNTMWASVTGEVEDVVYQIMSGTGPKAKAMVVSDVTKKLSHLRQLIDKEHLDKSNPGFKYEDAKKSVAEMNAAFKDLVAIAKTLPRRDSDLILGFCYDRARNALGEDEGSP